MQSNKILFPMFIIQLFADGGAGAGGGTGAAGATGATSDAAGQSTGAKADLSTVKYGIQDGADAAGQQVSQEQRTAKFEELIKGEYKDLYDARVQDTISKRFRATDAKVKAYDDLAPVLDRLNTRYGLKDGDIEGLNKAIDDDISLWEDEALERGMSVEELKNVRKMERENAALKEQLQAQKTRENADKALNELLQQEQAVKQIYPSFDLKAESQNPQFMQLYKAGINVQTAYEVVHKDEIITRGMQFAARETEKKLASSVAANRRRPAESAMSGQASVSVKSDVSQLTKADRREIARRVARGEKIRF